MNIAIVEDHLILREVVLEALRDKGYIAHGFESAEEMIEFTKIRKWDIAILDVNLPGENGYELAKRLRTYDPVMGIIILTIHKDLDHKLNGYDSGADLYLTKPIEIKELVATIKAIERRLKQNNDISDVISLDLQRHRVGCSNAWVNLSEVEVRLLHHLSLAPEKTLESWQLLEIMNYSLDQKGKKHLEVTISRLRSKLLDAIGLKLIHTVHGIGYKLTSSIQAEISE